MAAFLALFDERRPVVLKQLLEEMGMRYAIAALVASFLVAPAMAAELTDAEMDTVTAGHTRPASVLAGVPGVVSQVTSGTTSSTASVTVTE